MNLFFVFVYMMAYARNAKKFDELRILRVTNTAFGRMMDLIGDNIFFWPFFIIHMFYYFQGNSLINLMDSMLFTIVYPNDRKHRLIYACIMFVCNGYGILIYLAFGHLADRIEFPPTLYNLIIIYTVFLTNITTHGVALLMLHYFKFGTLQTLKRLNSMIVKNQITETYCLQMIRTLTNLNQKFHSIIGCLIIPLRIRDAFFIIFILFRLCENEITFFQFITTIAVIIYKFYILYLDYEIQNIFSRLCRSLRQRNQQEQQRQINGILLDQWLAKNGAITLDSTTTMKTTTKTTKTIGDDGLKSKNSITNHIDPKTMDSLMIGSRERFERRSSLVPKNLFNKITNGFIQREIRYFEMDEIYHEYYRFRIYDLYEFDMNSYLRSLLFSINYFVLLTQTRQQ